VRTIAVPTAAAGVGTVDLSVAEAGAPEDGTTAPRRLLLTHGFTGNKDDFIRWLPGLAEAGWHAVAVDMRGHGESGQPEPSAAYSLDALVEDVTGTMDALGWDTCAALGHSMGGMAVQLAALAHPERFTALVLMDTNHGPLHFPLGGYTLVAMTLRLGGTKALFKLAKATGSMRGGPTQQALAARDPRYQDEFERRFQALPAGAFLGWGAALAGCPDRLDALAGIAVPTLVVVGEGDEDFLPASRAMGARIPGAQLVVLPGAGHAPQYEAPEAWWAALTGFLAGLPAPA
jgi:pimeloyl-ACP methyl ester carboxylesterase